MTTEHLTQLQDVFLLLVLGVLAFLIVNGLVTQSVWVRGARSGFSLTQWAHKRSRQAEPRTYYLAMVFYGLAFVWLSWLWFNGSAF